jgi:hypothetical protein
MKRLITLLVLLALVGASISAEGAAYPTLTPKNAKSMGMGGVFSSVMTSEFSFFGNPAAFANKKGSLTLISADTWAYVKPTSANIATLMSMAGGEMDAMSALPALMPDNGGFGAGASMGFGYAGRGLGLGVFVTTDEYANGRDLPGAALTSDTEASAVIGLGVPINLGSLRLSVGGDLRPFYRIRSDEIGLADAVAVMDQGDDAILGALTVNSGFGLAMDLGATLELGSLAFGLSIRDIAPSFPVWSGSGLDLYDYLVEGSLPPTADSADTAIFVPNLTAGLSWKPRFIPGLLQPSFYLELQDPVSVIKDKESVYNLLHAGAELKILSFITLRGGINKGWLSVGAGMKLFFLDLNASVFTEELGALPGDNPRSGIAVQAAVRF